MLQEVVHHRLDSRVIRLLRDLVHHVLIDEILERHLHDADVAAEAAARLDSKALGRREARRQHVADLRRRARDLIGDIRAAQFHFAILFRSELAQDVSFNQICNITQDNHLRF